MSEDREILDTKSMLEDGFLQNLSSIKKNPNVQMDKIKRQQEAIDLIEDDNEESNESDAKHSVDTEAVILELFDIRDDAIKLFSNLGLSDKNSQVVSGIIEKTEKMIVGFGGAVEQFDPFSVEQELRAPDMKLNANKVIESTKNYSLCKIANSKVSNDGKSIQIEFSGEKNDIEYKSVGTVVAKSFWNGNEVIGYVYSPSSGKMSVKSAGSNGEWIDQSDNFKISWELYEQKKEDTVKQEENNVETSEDEDLACRAKSPLPLGRG